MKHTILTHTYHFAVYAVCCAVFLLAAWLSPGKRLRLYDVLYALASGWIIVPAIFVASVAHFFRLKK